MLHRAPGWPVFDFKILNYIRPDTGALSKVERPNGSLKDTRTYLWPKWVRVECEGKLLNISNYGTGGELLSSHFSFGLVSSPSYQGLSDDSHVLFLLLHVGEFNLRNG